MMHQFFRFQMAGLGASTFKFTSRAIFGSEYSALTLRSKPSEGSHVVLKQSRPLAFTSLAGNSRKSDSENLFSKSRWVSSFVGNRQHSNQAECTDSEGRPKPPSGFNCWNCSKFLDCISHNSEEKFKCSGCDIIQPPREGLNYFQYFGLESSYAVEKSKLQKNFRQLQFIVHPDHFSQKSETERNYADQQSALVNKAYRTLLNPLSRAEYILELNGHQTKEDDQSGDPTLLMEILELNEEINDAESDEEVKEIEAKASEVVKCCEVELQEAFADENFDVAKSITDKMRYFATVLKNAHKKLGWDP